jgi:hypothetical protein
MAAKNDIESKIFKIVGYQFNLSSNKQLIKAIYEDAGLPVIEKTSAGNPSTTEATLKKLAEEYELAKLILDYKKGMKRSSGRDEPKKAPKPGMPQERQVLLHTDIVDELNRDPQDILEDENKKADEKTKQQTSVEPSDEHKDSAVSDQTGIFVAQNIDSMQEQNSSENSPYPTMPGIDMQPPVTVSVAMDVPQESKDEVNSATEEKQEEDKVISFGVSNSFSLSKDQENAHNVIRENEHKDENKPKRKSGYDLDDDEPSENEFSKNSASLNVRRKEEFDYQTESKSKVGLYIMVLVVILAVVLVGLCVNTLTAMG